MEIALAKVFDYGCDNSNFHYFFISPGDFKGKVANEINCKPNFHHIRWKTDEFLAFIDKEMYHRRQRIFSTKVQPKSLKCFGSGHIQMQYVFRLIPTLT